MRRRKEEHTVQASRHSGLHTPTGAQKYYTGLQTDATTGAEPRPAEPAAEEALDLVSDSCIDWGALSPREVAAAFVMLKGGRKQEAESLLVSVLAELRQDRDKAEAASSRSVQTVAALEGQLNSTRTGVGALEAQLQRIQEEASRRTAEENAREAEAERTRAAMLAMRER